MPPRFWDSDAKPIYSGYLLDFCVGDTVEVDTQQFGWLKGSVDNMVLGDKPIVIVLTVCKKRVYVVSESCIRKVTNE